MKMVLVAAAQRPGERVPRDRNASPSNGLSGCRAHPRCGSRREKVANQNPNEQQQRDEEQRRKQQQQQQGDQDRQQGGQRSDQDRDDKQQR